MFQIGQKIRLWKCRTDAHQLKIEQQFMLTITGNDSDIYYGTIEDGSIYAFEFGYWFSRSINSVAKLDTAVRAWNVATEKDMRVISLPEREDIKPDGDVAKCTEHNRYYLSGTLCQKCRKKNPPWSAI